MRRRRFMKEESKYNYKYGKTYSASKNKTSRDFSFKLIVSKIKKVFQISTPSFGLKLKSKDSTTVKSDLPKKSKQKFNFRSKFEKASDSISGLHKNKFFLGSLALLILFAVILTGYNYFSNKHYIVYADGEPIGFVRDEVELDLMLSILHDYGPSADEEAYVKAMEALGNEDEEVADAPEEPTEPDDAPIGSMSVATSEEESQDDAKGDQELNIEDVIDMESRDKNFNIVTAISTELVYTEPEELPQLTLTKLKESVYIETGAAVIMINGEEIAALKDYNTAENVINVIVESYLTERGGSKIVDHKIQEDIEIVIKPVPPEDIITRDIALNLLSTGYTERQVHVVQRGDSLWSIGNQNGMSVSEVKECNPQLTSNILLIGQEIAIEPLIPYVHVETYEKQTTIEYIPFSTSYTEDNSMYTWESRTVTAGVRGRNEVVYDIVRVNGVEQARKKVSTERLSDPVTRVIARGTKTPVATGTGTFIWPVDGGGRITSPFGNRRGGFHYGVDIACSVGTRIFAADDGVVTTSAYHRGYGYYIVIDHGNGFSTLYAHNSRLLKSVGAKVSKGDVIAYSGNTGNSTGPHLHFEIRLNGSHQNPMNYFR